MSKSLGRPKIYDFEEEPLKPIAVRLTEYHKRLAKRFGEGNASAGIRKALEFMKTQPKEPKK